MGVIDMASLKAKTERAVGDLAHTLAAEAYRGRARVYCPVLPKASGVAAGIDTFGLAIDGIEAAGWQLEQWAIDSAGNGRPVFRRVVDETLTNQ